MAVLLIVLGMTVAMLGLVRPDQTMANNERFKTIAKEFKQRQEAKWNIIEEFTELAYEILPDRKGQYSEFDARRIGAQIRDPAELKESCKEFFDLVLANTNELALNMAAMKQDKDMKEDMKKLECCCIVVDKHLQYKDMFEELFESGSS